jgi:hypothetical protein
MTRLGIVPSFAKSAALKSVIEKFREKYGAKDVKTYYSKLDVAVVAELG